jgi:hypothetical protein
MKPTNHGAPLRTRHAAWESFLALAAAADGGTSRGRWAKKATSIIAPVAALATLAVLAAGCGGGSSSPGVAQVESGNSTTNSSAAGAKSHSLTAFTKCMRSHGILLFPDPNSNGQISPSAGVHLSSPLFRKAQDACKSLLPRAGTFTAGGARLSPQQQAQLLRYAKCMRAHGLTKIPRPRPHRGRGGARSVRPQLAPVQIRATSLPLAASQAPRRPGDAFGRAREWTLDLRWSWRCALDGHKPARSWRRDTAGTTAHRVRRWRRSARRRPGRAVRACRRDGCATLDKRGRSAAAAAG